MNINGKQITVGSLATLIPIAMFYFYIADKGLLPISEAAHAQDISIIKCNVANLEWSRAADNLRYAQALLKADPDNLAYQKDVDNYAMQKAAAQKKIDTYC